MSQSQEARTLYTKTAAELRQRLSTVSPLDRMKFALDVFQDFRPQRSGRQRGGAVSPIHPIRADGTQHTFNDPERFFLVTEALDLMDSVAKKGTTIEYEHGRVVVPSFDAYLHDAVQSIPTGPIPINVHTSRAQYIALLGTILKYPYTAPPLKAMLAVAGHDGIRTASMQGQTFLNILKEHLDYSRNYGHTSVRITSSFNDIPQSGQLFVNLVKIIERDGTVSPDVKRACAERYPASMPYIKHLITFIHEMTTQETGSLAPDFIHRAFDGHVVMGTYIESAQKLLKHPDTNQRRMGLSLLKLALNLEMEYNNKSGFFWGYNQYQLGQKTLDYEVVCLGRAVAKRVHEYYAQAIYGYTAASVLQGDPNPATRMHTNYKIADTQPLDEFTDTVGISALRAANTGESLEELALRSLHGTKIPDDDLVEGAMRYFLPFDPL